MTTYFTWTMLIIGASDLYTVPSHIQIPFINQESCETAAKDLLSDSRGIGIVCMDGLTGKVIRVNPERREIIH